MKLTALLPALIGVSGIVSWSIVSKYRKAWGAESGVAYICKRLIAEKKLEGWMLVFSQLIAVVAAVAMLWLINTR